MNNFLQCRRFGRFAVFAVLAGAFLGLHASAQEVSAVSEDSPRLTRQTPAAANDVGDIPVMPPSLDWKSAEAPKDFGYRDSIVDNDLKNEFAVWGGYSPDSTTALPFAGTKDARFGIVGLKYSRRFNNNSTINLKYTAELYPAAGLNFADRGSRRTVYAWGGSPFGVQMNFRPRKKIQPFVGAAGGALYFSKKIPNELGTKFNFTADFSGGLEIRVSEDRNLSFGYKLFHISNGGRGDINPSFDNNVLFVGYSFLF